MRMSAAILALAVATATPAAAQQHGLTGAEIRLPARLDAQLREYFAQDEELLIDRLRESLEEIEQRERTEKLRVRRDGGVVVSE